MTKKDLMDMLDDCPDDARIWLLDRDGKVNTNLLESFKKWNSKTKKLDKTDCSSEADIIILKQGEEG